MTSQTSSQVKTFKTQAEQHNALFEFMLVSATEKVAFWESIGLTRAEAIAKAKTQTCAGRKVWERIEGATLCTK